MIIHDSTFNDLANAPVKQTDVVVARQIQDPYGYYDDTLIWKSSDYLMSVTIDCIGSFLGTATKKATVKLIGIIDTSNVDDVFQIRLGLYDSSLSSFNYISEGMFIIDNIAYDYEAGSTTIIMYDHMWLAQKNLYADALKTYGFAYPTTVQGLASRIASILGVNLSSDFSSLPNYDYIIATDPYATISNITLQSILAEIASSTCSTARITDGTLVFSKYSVSDEVLDSNTLKKLKIGNNYGPITSVVLGRTPQNDNIVKTNNISLSNIVTSVDTTNSLLTINGNGMEDGTLIRLSSTVSLPSPLLSNTNYYIHNNDNNTFSLADNYEDAISGSSTINITSSGSGVITLDLLAIQEVQINNNQILDDDRQDLLLPIYSSIIGAGWNESNSDTIGLGWHEVGDVISFSQGTVIYQSFINEIHLILSGSISENIISYIPKFDTVNYQTAGGILKSIYNTEIKTDKQNNTITSIVERQDVTDSLIQSNYTELSQNIENIQLTVQETGGINIIENSVGYAFKTDGSIDMWEISGTGTATSQSSPGSLYYGSSSGYEINVAGSSAVLSQRVLVTPGQEYSLSFIAKKNSSGSAQIKLSNSTDDFHIDLSPSVSYLWESFKLEGFIPTDNYLDIEIKSTNADGFSITDLMLNKGNVSSTWAQASNEVLSQNVIVNKNGITIKSNVFSGDFTQITPVEFAGYSNVSGTQKKVFTLNRDVTVVEKLQSKNGIIMSPIKIIPITSGPIKGLAFVKET